MREVHGTHLTKVICRRLAELFKWLPMPRIPRWGDGEIMDELERGGRLSNTLGQGESPCTEWAGLQVVERREK